MKTVLLAILLLALPVLSEDATELSPFERVGRSRELAIREYYEEWFAANRENLEEGMKSIAYDPKCRKGSKEKGLAKWGEFVPGAWKLPERTDPMYLSWKALRRQQYIASAFERTWGGMMEPTQWAKFQAKHITSSDFYQWIKENLEVKSVYPFCVADLADGPSPELWTADQVSPSGKSVDKHGEVTVESATSSRSTHVKWFWIPFAIGFPLAVFFSLKGTSPTLGFCLGYFGYGLLVGSLSGIGATEGLKQVSLELMSVGVIVMIVLVGIVKLALSGLGLKKDA